MEYDYNKIVCFLFGRQVNKLNEVLKYNISNDFLMLDVNIPNKVILLEKDNLKYVMYNDNNKVMIIPDGYRSLCFSDDFGEIIEINTNGDGDIIVSKIFRYNNSGAGAITSTWKYENGEYIEIVGRVMFIEQKELEIVENQDSIEMFLNKYSKLRNDVLNDLYWDLNMFAKNNFINVKLSERIMISDGFNKDKFEVLYKKHIDKAFKTIEEKSKPSLF